MHLVDEQNNTPVRLAHFGQNSLETFLEFASEFGPGQERTHFESKDRLVLEAFGYVPAHDTLCKTLNDSGLPYPGFTDEYGVVLGLAGKDANDPANFGIPTDHGIELAGLGLLDQIDTVLL